MKKLVFLTFSILLVISLSANDLALDNLFGQVESVVTEIKGFNAEFGKTNQVFISKNNVIYNRMGNYVEKKYFRQNGALMNKEVFLYASDGLIQESSTYYADGTLYSKKSYDILGKLIEDATYKADGSYETLVTLINDSNSNLVERNFYLNDGVLRCKTIYVYNGAGKILEVQSYGKDGVITGLSKYSYDSKGYKLTESGSSGKMSSFSRYNEKGYLIEQSSGSEENMYSDSRTTYSYDNQNNLIEIIYFRNTKNEVSKYIYEYDLKGNLITENYYYNNLLQSKFVFSVEYDSLGNWVKKTKSKVVSKFGKVVEEPEEVVTRSITYHAEKQE